MRADAIAIRFLMADYIERPMAFYKIEKLEWNGSHARYLSSPMPWRDSRMVTMGKRSIIQLKVVGIEFPRASRRTEYTPRLISLVRQYVKS